MASTPVFWPEKAHGQKSLAGYSPMGHRVKHDWATKHSTHTAPYPSHRNALQKAPLTMQGCPSNISLFGWP